MEMEEIGKEPEYSSGEGTSETMLKTEDKPETDLYSKLNNPSEDLYAEAKFNPRPSKEKKGWSLQPWQRACVCLGAVCLILILAVIILALRLQNGPSDCVKKTSLENSRILYLGCPSTIQSPFQSPPQSPLCAKGWLQSGRACFLFSTRRKTWTESKTFCEEQGGKLAVITDGTVQNFLTETGNVVYWIGLSKENNQVWTWVDGQRLTGNSFWSVSNPGVGDCAVLVGKNGDNKSWSKSFCTRPKYYICQKPIIEN